MNEDIRSFLAKFSPEELDNRGVLSADSRFGYLLRGKNVAALIVLMNERKISRLEAVERNWYLTSEFAFTNPAGEYKTGNAKDSSNLRSVFNDQNPHINPYFRSSVTQDAFDIDPNGVHGTPVESTQVKFGLERDLQSALRRSIDQLEPGLKIIDNNTELSVDAGRIDITAEDTEGQLVVIELKAGTAQPEAVAQLLAYMGTIENPDNKRIRGILVASNFNQRVVYAAQAVPNLSLKAYSFQFSFNDR